MEQIALSKVKPEYVQGQPYHPSTRYKEYPFKDIATGEENHVYTGIREVFKSLQMDIEGLGTSDWNPLGELIRPGNVVLIKPNMVKESHLTRPDDYEYVITHGAVIRAVCDYVVLALKGDGNVIFADAPETDANFDLICQRNGVHRLIEFYRKNVPSIQFQLLDLRKEQWKKRDGVITDKWPLPGDPAGYSRIALNGASEFVGHGSQKEYFGATFDMKETQRHHHGFVHEYLISSSVLNADVVINLPKLKTHKKGGITCCLKNLVGINGDKNWLPHHTEGIPKNGGDQFPEATAKATLEYKLFGGLKSMAVKSPEFSKVLGMMKRYGRFYFGSTEKVIRSGNWYGNDTVWRMILDLNKIIFHYDADGKIREKKRKMFCLVDAVLAGEGIGPMHPDCKPLGVLVGGFDPAVVERCCARIMGFDYKKIPSIHRAFHIESLPITQAEDDPITVISNEPSLCGHLDSLVFDKSWSFEPHFGWKGHIELDEQQ